MCIRDRQDVGKVGVRNCAWEHRVAVAVVGASYGPNLLSMKQRLLNTIQIICSCANDAFSASVEFYKFFMCFQLTVCVFLSTIFLLVESVGFSFFYLVFLIVRLSDMLIVLHCCARQ